MTALGLLCGRLLAAAVRVLTVVAIFGLGVLSAFLWATAHGWRVSS